MDNSIKKVGWRSGGQDGKKNLITHYDELTGKKYCSINDSRKTVFKTIVKNVDLENVRSHRAGVIIYTFFDGIIYFGLGVDAKTHDLTDFAGSIKYKIDIDVIHGALREFEEESLSIFNPITIDDISQCPVIYDESNLIIFIHLMINPNAISLSFNQRYIEVNQGSPYFPEIWNYLANFG